MNRPYLILSQRPIGYIHHPDGSHDPIMECRVKLDSGEETIRWRTGWRWLDAAPPVDRPMPARPGVCRG